ELLRWHARFCHLSGKQLKHLLTSGLISGVDPLDIPFEDPICDECPSGKMTQKSFPKNRGHPATEILQRIHSDVSGPFPLSVGGHKSYCVEFIDEFS
ncbi:hypothetical protein SISSUDRAFT_959526, partial [Sistotremastrum suecicum HHB10207 ss-3]